MTTATEPIQKLSNCMNPMFNRISGSNVANTTPPAKIPTAIFVSTYATSDMTDSTQRAAGLKRRSRNSGIV
jgi:hypothetical protein